MATCPICGANHISCRGLAPDPSIILDYYGAMPMVGTIYTADRRIYVDAAGRVVDERDPNKAMLLVPAGGTLPLDYARSLGLVPEPTPIPEPAPDETDAQTAVKAAPPSRNKARRASANKGA